MGRDQPVLLVGSAPLLAVAGEVLAADGVRVLRRPDLTRAGIPRRVELVVLADGDDLRRQLVQVQAGARARRRPLRVVVVREPAAPGVGGGGEGARARADEAAAEYGLRLQWLEPERTAARVLLARWPLHRALDPPAGQRPHVLIAGFGPFARALFLHTLRIGQYGERPPLVTLAAEEPAQWREWIAAQHPQADACAELRFVGLRALKLEGEPPLTTVAVCERPPEPALDLARALMTQAVAQGASPLVLLVADGAWPDGWGRGGLPDWDGQLVPVSPLRLAFSREVLVEGREDALAEVIHEHYRDTSAAQGRDPAAAPSGRPWPELATSYRDANRHQADHLWAKLAVTDCRAVPEELVESFAFAPGEVERLAIIEHRRWAVERWLDGWRYGPERDNAEKLHPQLIPYADLTDAMQDLDRFAVRLVPALLARSGLAVVRRLIVGVQGGVEIPPSALHRAARQVLQRLVARYPDRGLTLALDPTDAAARGIAVDALKRFGVGLFVLLPAPLPRLLATQTPASRLAMLGLLSAAERRIQLADRSSLAHWLARRAEVLFVVGEPATRPPTGVEPPAKLVRLDAGGRARWSFEY